MRRGVYIECARVDPLLKLGNINRESENPFIGLYKLLLLGWWPSPTTWINNGSLDLTSAQESHCEICAGLWWWDHDILQYLLSNMDIYKISNAHHKSHSTSKTNFTFTTCSHQPLIHPLYTTQPNPTQPDVHEKNAKTPPIYTPPVTWIL